MIECVLVNDWDDKGMIIENVNLVFFIYNQVQKGDCNSGIVISKVL